MAQYAQIVFEFGVGAPGDSFSFYLGGVLRTFNIVTTPSGSYDVQAGASIADDFENTLGNPGVLPAQYGAVRSGIQVTITANTYDDDLNFGTVDLTNAGSSDIIIISQQDNESPTGFDVSHTRTNVTCNGAADGTIDLSVSGGQAPYTYAWADGPTTQDRAGLGPGSYSVTVTDANDVVEVYGPINISQPTAVVITVESVTHVACNGGANGAIDISASGGAGGYTYSWADGPTTQDRTGLGAGVYTVTVTDADGCTAVLPIEVTQPSAIVITPAVTHVACNGASSGAINIGVAGGTPGYTYSWADGPTTQNRTALPAGTYTVTVTDANGCTAELGINVTQPTALAVTLGSVTHVICNGGANGAIDINVAGGTPGYTYSWADGPTTQDRTGLTAGVYTVTVTDANGCSDELEVEVTQPTAIVITLASVTHVLCFGGATGAIDINVAGGTPGYTYSWADGPTTQDRTGLTAGVYTVTVTDANGCSDDLEVVVTQPTQILIEAEVFGNNIFLTVTGGTPGDPEYTYAWNTGAVTKDLGPIEPGEYFVVVTDSVGCQASADITVDEFQFFFSQNPIALVLQAADPETKPNLSFVNEVYVEEEYFTMAFTKVATEEHPATDEGGTVFQVESYLDAYLKSYLPSPTMSTCELATGMFKMYYLRHTEKFGEPPAEGIFTRRVTNFVLLGGLSDIEFAADRFFDEYLDAAKPFLNWDLASKIILPDQPEFLYFLANSFTLASFKVFVQVYWTDGTNSAPIEKFTKAVQNRYEVFCFPSGYAQLGIALVDEAKTVRHYKLWVEDAEGEVISMVKTYELDFDYYPEQRFVVFLSSLGGFTTLAMTGTGAREVSVSQETIEKNVGHSFLITDLGDKVTASAGQPVIRFNSGYITNQEYFERLEDFLQAEEVYLYEPAAGSSPARWVPVTLEAGKTTMYDEGRRNALNVISGELRLPKQRRYTPRL